MKTISASCYTRRTVPNCILFFTLLFFVFFFGYKYEIGFQSRSVALRTEHYWCFFCILYFFSSFSVWRCVTAVVCFLFFIYFPERQMPNGAFPFFFFFFFFFGRFRFCRLPLLSIRNEPSRPIAVPPSVPTRSLIFFSLAISVPQPLPVVFFFVLF